MSRRDYWPDRRDFPVAVPPAVSGESVQVQLVVFLMRFSDVSRPTDLTIGQGHKYHLDLAFSIMGVWSSENRFTNMKIAVALDLCKLIGPNH
jgi:hypothetical protein